MAKPQSSNGTRTPLSRTLSPSSSAEGETSLRALELELGPGLHRSNSFSSIGGFEFEHALLPLTLSGEAAAEDGHVEHKHVGLLHGVYIVFLLINLGMALVVGMQVGSGIFSSPGVVVASVGSTGASLLVWLVSGLLAWTGAR